MKKVFTLLLCVVLLGSVSAVAFAEVDLNSMSYDELVALKDKINLAIWNSEEWEEVEVPHGVWYVGADIPAGKWTVTAGDGCNLRFDLGKELDATGTELTNIDNWWRLISATNRGFNPSSDVESVTVDLAEGTIVIIDKGSVIFTPYSGKPSLGFKAKKTSSASDNSDFASVAESAEETVETLTEVISAEDSGKEASPAELNAVRSAKSYLDFMGFSRDGLIDQLESFDNYTHDQAVYGADHSGADWNVQAARSAKSYLDFMGFSRDGLIDQLESFDQYTHEQAVYGADSNDVDWNEQAVKSAQAYLEFMGFSRDGLIDQLESFDQYTHEQAVYAADKLGL